MLNVGTMVAGRDVNAQSVTTGYEKNFYQYQNLSVQQQGIILNNNHKAGVSQLGGDASLASATGVDDGGEIYAGMNITIGSVSGARTNNVYNISGTIAAAGGYLDISAATVENRKRVLTIARKNILLDKYGFRDNERWGSRKEKWWDQHGVTVTLDQLIEDSPSGVLTAAKNLVIQADTTTNAYSRIAAGENLSVTGANLTQVSTSLNKNTDDFIQHSHDDIVT